MSGASRRDFFKAAMAAGVGGAVATRASAAEYPSGPFWNNVPEPDLANKELPRFKFELEKTTGRVDGGSFGKEATVEQFPISTGIAGVSMKLEPGVARELHWHATAAEWAFVMDGRCRTTVINPNGQSATDDFEPGDVWYFPRGHGHSIQCLGDEPCHFILIFDNGYFSEFGTFSITDWLGHTPKSLLAKNLGMPESAFDNFPKSEAYFVNGVIPPEQPTLPHQGEFNPTPETHKYSLLKQEPKVTRKGGRIWRVSQNEFPIATTITGLVLELDPGALRELHWHPNADEWQYVMEGSISVTMFGAKGRYAIETLSKGDVGYIPQGYGHSIENTGTEKARILIAFNTGEYQAIDLSEWLASNPDYLLTAHFNQQSRAVRQFPKRDVFIATKEG
ncbi:oxalate decarboxylase [Pseudovibrio denitrificans]|uniref:Oxalate decarboxylase n=2 Tax=Pseudovibrio denitrificans TaxID=258256 RepID=A0A1I7B8I3_9HYPH|nr:cupin domain-containing protein [Pseudovibrio denitrificans]SFT83499.1 oxalate decarboxylase [Pseudovibrio denitrificans]